MIHSLLDHPDRCFTDFFVRILEHLFDTRAAAVYH